MLIAIHRRQGEASFTETCNKMMMGFRQIPGVNTIWLDRLIPGQESCNVCIGIGTASSQNQFKLLDPNAQVRVGYCVWESTKVPAHFRKDLEDVDMVVVPSKYVKEIFVKEKMKDPTDIYVCPDGVDTEFYKHRVRPWDRKPFRILDVSVIQLRKGHDILLKAFSELSDEMPGQMQLIIKGRPLGPGKYGEGIVKKYRDHDDIRIIESRLNPTELLALYHAADLFVHPHRSEGFGLTPLEAMRTGLPIITTGYSGVLEYCTTENAYFIGHKIVPVPKDSGFLGEYAEPDKNHLKSLIKYCFDNRHSALVRAANASKAAGSMTLKWSAEGILAAIKDYMVRHSIRPDVDINDKNNIFTKMPPALRVLWT